MNFSARLRVIRFPKSVTYIFLALGFAIMVWFIASFLPTGNDWRNYFRPAANLLLAGRSPYTVEGFASPPWILIPLIPIAVLPENVGFAVLTVLSFSTFAYAARRMGASPLAMLFFLTCSPLWLELLCGQIDWIISLGLFLPAPVGLFFVLAKPQAGIGIALFWLYEAYQKDGIKQVFKTFLPVSIAFLISFVLYGLWPLAGVRIVDNFWNYSTWPQSIIIGLVLLVSSFQKRSINLAVLTSPFLSPYTAIQSWTVALLGLLPSNKLFITAIIGTWIFKLLGGWRLSP